MYNKDEKLLINFDEMALAFANSIYADFLFSAKTARSMTNGRAFQLKIGQYVDQLRQRLETKAMEYLSVNRDLQKIDWFNKKLVYMIRQHIQDFQQRTETFRYHSLNEG